MNLDGPPLCTGLIVPLYKCRKLSLQRHASLCGGSLNFHYLSLSVQYHGCVRCLLNVIHERIDEGGDGAQGLYRRRVNFDGHVRYSRSNAEGVCLYSRTHNYWYILKRETDQSSQASRAKTRVVERFLQTLGFMVRGVFKSFYLTHFCLGAEPNQINLNSSPAFTRL